METDSFNPQTILGWQVNANQLVGKLRIGGNGLVNSRCQCIGTSAVHTTIPSCAAVLE